MIFCLYLNYVSRFYPGDNTDADPKHCSQNNALKTHICDKDRLEGAFSDYGEGLSGEAPKPGQLAQVFIQLNRLITSRIMNR